MANGSKVWKVGGRAQTQTRKTDERFNWKEDSYFKFTTWNEENFGRLKARNLDLKERVMGKGLSTLDKKNGSYIA